MKPLTRREFTKSIAAAGLATVSSARSAERVAGANDRVRLGCVGLGNRGDQVLDAFLTHRDCEVVALCDLNGPYLESAAHKAGGHPELVRDYRKVLERPDVDAVVICTPDHWHALQMIEACQAGKDVYVEKPFSLCVNEGRKMVEAARRHRRVVQVGIQRLSNSYCREAAEIVRGGGIGKVTVVRCFHIQNEWPKGIGNPPDEEPPADFDWDRWLGPAPKRAYNRNRAFYRFRWFYDYSGGQLTNFGVHYLAHIHWALGVDTPKSTVVMGGKYAAYDNREVPDTMEALWHYPGDTLVSFSQFNATSAPASVNSCEIEFRGTQGTLYVKGNGYEIVPETILDNEFPAFSPVNRALQRAYRTGGKRVIEARQQSGTIRDSDHARNFLDCIKSRQRCACDVEFGHRATSAALIANIAHRTRSYLEWDGAQERFTNRPEANERLGYTYRLPYQFPA